MKRLGVFAILAFFGIQTPALGVTWESIKKAGKIRAASEGAYPPFNVFKDGKISGFEIDLVEAIAKRLGLTVEWKTGSFDTLLIGLDPKHDRYDLVAASHTITPERGKVVEFTKPEYCSQIVLVTNDGKPMKLADIKGKKVSIQVGTTGVPMLSKIDGLTELKTFPTDPEAMQALLMGRVDAWVSEIPIVAEAKKQHPTLTMGEPLTQLQIGIAVGKGKTVLRDKLNEAMTDLMRDGTYTAIRKKYMDYDVACR